jgi:MtN3 and saliva related transmembrane protein
LDTTQLIGLAAGICTSISLLPQLIKMFKNKSAGDISLFYLAILLAGLLLWIWYGFRREDTPILITNIFSLTLNILLIIMGIYYKRKNPEGAVK